MSERRIVHILQERELFDFKTIPCCSSDSIELLERLYLDANRSLHEIDRYLVQNRIHAATNFDMVMIYKIVSFK